MEWYRDQGIRLLFMQIKYLLTCTTLQYEKVIEVMFWFSLCNILQRAVCNYTSCKNGQIKVRTLRQFLNVAPCLIWLRSIIRVILFCKQMCVWNIYAKLCKKYHKIRQLQPPSRQFKVKYILFKPLPSHQRRSHPAAAARLPNIVPVIYSQANPILIYGGEIILVLNQFYSEIERTSSNLCFKKSLMERFPL